MPFLLVIQQHVVRRPVQTKAEVRETAVEDSVLLPLRTLQGCTAVFQAFAEEREELYRFQSLALLSFAQ